MCDNNIPVTPWMINGEPVKPDVSSEISKKASEMFVDICKYSDFREHAVEAVGILQREHTIPPATVDGHTQIVTR